MDANFLISSNNKHHKKHQRSMNICDLPDEILQEIISNLSTKEAVQTSILSKRWIDQWMNISKIELEEGAPEKRQKIVDFVGKLLVVCSPSNLKKFSLLFEVGADAPLVNRWLCGFINPNIQELNLDFERVEESLVFPNHLFTSETLIKFQLCMQQVINLPSFICFRSLRTLTLKDVIFPATCSTQNLFSNCPSLEELNLTDCNWMNVRNVCIACPLLQRVIIREWKDDYKDDDNHSDNGQGVPNFCRIVIMGTNLKTFSYDGDLLNDYFLHSATSVVNAIVQVHPADNNNLVAGVFVFKLLKAVPNVQKLSLNDSAAEALCHSSFLIANLSLFYNLVELRVVSGVSPINLTCEALLTVLRKSPSLETVEFVMGVSLPSLPRNDATNISPLPACFGTHLKTIKIHGFSGNVEELNAIRFLLRAASVLDTLYIYHNEYEFDCPEGPERLNHLYDLIERFPRTSVDCEVDFD
ncbi:F-box/LRR-repeat protein At3g26922-like [Gastrolobium bilobum]|uniref:F-box/LRR-repeat protein At3g26922-like n=1 Tax=Gastrolobium bilobum TaxID=150636 RepID=UPI002AAF84B2|nr:F-box/LRR-repeat protein At3g26922-like [Gastrolobium bilobum]